MGNEEARSELSSCLSGLSAAEIEVDIEVIGDDEVVNSLTIVLGPVELEFDGLGYSENRVEALLALEKLRQACTEAEKAIMEATRYHVAEEKRRAEPEE